MCAVEQRCKLPCDPSLLADPIRALEARLVGLGLAPEGAAPDELAKILWLVFKAVQPEASADAFDAWLRALPADPRLADLPAVEGELVRIDHRLEYGFTSPRTCAARAAYRLWRIAQFTPARPGTAATFATWLGAVADTPELGDDACRQTDYVLAAAGCCGNAKALTEVQRRINALARKIAYERSLPDVPSSGDVLFSGKGVNALCAYEARGGARLNTYLYRLISWAAHGPERPPPEPPPPPNPEPSAEELEFLGKLLEVLPRGHALALQLSVADGLGFREASARMVLYEKNGFDFECPSKAWHTGGGLNRWLHTRVLPHAQEVAEMLARGPVGKQGCNC